MLTLQRHTIAGSQYQQGSVGQAGWAVCMLSRIPPSNELFQLPPSNGLFQLPPSNELFQLPPSNELFQLPP